MSASCTKCGITLQTSWSFCPQCGVAASHEPRPHADPQVHEKSSVPGAFGGLLFGVIAAPVLIIFGGLLCLTGLGAFLGAPMIVVGVIAPLAALLFGFGEHQVRCPCCNTREITIADDKMHYCPNCDHEFAVGEHHAVRAG